MDRIFDAYNGNMGVEFMRKTRERLNWICSRVQGRRVLDVGCSQGVVPILLGRSGFVVQGLDINPKAVEFAANELKKELPTVQRNVTFSVGNFAQFDSGDAKYDTVVIGEVLEHLVRPDVFVSKAFDLLNVGGLILITVPFGINDDPDHRQTFYFSKIKTMLSPYFNVKETAYFGAWIGFVAERREEKIPFEPGTDFRDLIDVEDAIFKQERSLRDQIGVLQINCKKQLDAALELKDKVAKLTSEKADLAKAKAAAEGEVARQKAEVAKMATEKTGLAKDLADEKAWADEHKKEFERFLKETESEKKTLEHRIVQEQRSNGMLKRERDSLARQYRKLSESKLGRLTLAYWRFKDGKK